MCGVAIVTTSPSSSNSRRKTPWVAGCDGPILSTIFSPIWSWLGTSSACACSVRARGSGASISRWSTGIKQDEWPVANCQSAIFDVAWLKMNRQLGIRFAGQGAQTVGMGRDLAAEFVEAADLFRRADEVLGRKLSEIAWNGPLEELTRTANCQPALY